MGCVDKHTHRSAQVLGPFPFQGCVSEHHCVPEAHGGDVYTQVCVCGARQNVNLRGNHQEVGEWIIRPDSESYSRTRD